MCDICIKHVKLGQKNNFITGCTVIKLDSIIKHEQSAGHKRAVEIERNSVKPLSSAPASQIIQTLNKSAFDKLTILFRTCHAIALSDRPITDYEWILDLDEAKGLNVGNTYRNNKSAKVFLGAIAENEMQKISDSIKRSNFLCLIGDGSTDSSTKDQEMWFLRTCKDGKINTFFVGVFSPDKANAENICSGLKELFKALNIDWTDIIDRVVGLSCDGASVMTGIKSGVGALLREENPCVITIHCLAHRLELALKDLSKTNSMYKKTVDTLLLGLYLFYHKSSLNRAMLVRSHNALKQKDDPDLLMPSRVGGTRWISHTIRAILNCLTSYKYIVNHLGQLTETSERVSHDSRSKAKAFLKMLESKDVMYFLHFLMDVLKPIQRLSLTLQSNDCVLSSQYSEISTAIATVEKYKTSDGPNLRKVSTDNSFADLKGNCTNFAASRIDFIDKLQSALRRRFSDFSDPGVVSATKLSDLKQFPKSWKSLEVHGDKDLITLMTHYADILHKAGVDIEEAEMEWTRLKKELLDGYGDELSLTDWMSINEQHQTRFPNVLKVVDLIMTLSPSSAQAERGFSQLKLIKTRLRTCLNQDTLNDLMFIKLHSSTIKDYDPVPAINLWNSGSIRGRRPFVMDSKIPKSVSTCIEKRQSVVNRDLESNSQSYPSVSQSIVNTDCESNQSSIHIQCETSQSNVNTECESSQSIVNIECESSVSMVQTMESISESVENSQSDTCSILCEDTSDSEMSEDEQEVYERLEFENEIETE